MLAGGASVPRAPGLADLPNVTHADFWLNRASVQERDGNYQVPAPWPNLHHRRSLHACSCICGENVYESQQLKAGSRHLRVSVHSRLHWKPWRQGL